MSGRAAAPGSDALAAEADLHAFVAALRQEGPFVAHEVLEAPWRRAGAPLYRQDAAQALIQLCAAYVQRSRPNARGARLLVARAADRLSRPVDGAIDAALVAAGIDRAALLRRLSVLPESVEAWPSILDLLLGGETDRP